MNRIDAQLAREERAVEVEASYEIEHVGLMCWLVKHPTEDERCYLVEMLTRTCSCPDFVMTANPQYQIDCKHIVAIDPLWREMTGQERAPFMLNGRPTTDAGFVAVVDPDPDDPFRD